MARYGDGISSFSLTELPGCTQVCVSHGCFVQLGKRGKGVGQREHKARLAEMRRLGYDSAICTVRKDNATERHILHKFGWREVDSFTSTKNGGTILLCFKDLSAPDTKKEP